jgi:hypothetical protein
MLLEKGYRSDVPVMTAMPVPVCFQAEHPINRIMMAAAPLRWIS